MRLLAIGLAASMASALSLSAAAQDVPSNAELYRMLKAQQKTTDQLRGELRKKRPKLQTTDHDLKRGDHPLPVPTARVYEAPYVDKIEGLKASAAKPDRSSLSIDGSYLYFKPYLTDTFFASVGTAAGSPSGTLIANNPDFTSAFRVGATYTNGTPGYALTASYTQLDASSLDQLSGSNLWAARGSADLLANFENYTGTATSDIGLKYRSADVLMSQPIDLGVSRLNFVYGGEYADMSWDEAETYSRTNELGTSMSSSKFSGFGAQAGLNWTFQPFGGFNPALDGFSIETGATAGLLLASSKSSLSDHFNGTNIGSVETESTHRIIPVAHARVALAYNYSWDGYSITTKAGYEYLTYINGLQRLGNLDDVADGQYTVRYHDFNLGGLFAMIKLTAGL
jgi:Legionella pneumophila major outer membrane protein precursor